MLRRFVPYPAPILTPVQKPYCTARFSGVDSLSGQQKGTAWGEFMKILRLCLGEEGQDIAEYAVMLAVILVLVIGTIRLVGGNANNAFSSVASNLQ
jgi:Flp pilus assembly pilin Flp